MTNNEIRERVKKTGDSVMDFAFKARVKYPMFNAFMSGRSTNLSKENHEIVEAYIIQNHFTDLEKVEYSAREIEKVLELVGTVSLKMDGEVFCVSGKNEVIQLPF